MARNQASMVRRQRERARQQKRREKQAKRAQRREEKKLTTVETHEDPMKDETIDWSAAVRPTPLDEDFTSVSSLQELEEPDRDVE